MENAVKKSHVRAVARAGPVLRAVTGLALAFLGCAILGGCDKPNEPKPASKYLLYAGMTTSIEPWDGFIAIIDCETDSIIDSVALLSYFSQPGVVVSPDGRYFAPITTQPAMIFDAVTRLPIGTLLTPGLPLFLPDAGLLLCARVESTLVYDIPGFTLRESWPRPRGPAERVPGRQQVAAFESGVGEYAGHSKLVLFDYVNYRAVDSAIIDPEAQGAGFQVRNFTFSPDGMRLYAIGGQSGFGSGVIGYDLRTRKILFRQSLYGPFGYCRVTPNGSEVWVTDPGSPIVDFPDWPETIFIYDAITGTLIDTVSIRGISPNPYRPLVAQDIRFLPDGSKAYVNCGSSTKGRQPILVIATRTRQIERLLFGDFNNLAMMIDIAPYP